METAAILKRWCIPDAPIEASAISKDDARVPPYLSVSRLRCNLLLPAVAGQCTAMSFLEAQIEKIYIIFNQSHDLPVILGQLNDATLKMTAILGNART